MRLPTLVLLFSAVPAFAAQPIASRWHPDELLTWSPAADPDAPFNRATVPLAPRFSSAPRQAQVAALVSFGATSGNPSQGSPTQSFYALNYWQYLDVLVFWGGSASEGLILAPNATVIDAAHRNGVQVLGNVFFPQVAHGGQIQWVRELVQKSGNVYPVADKLIEVAQHYGFDGWFLNQETTGGDAALAAQLRDFIRYLKAHSTLRVVWYDSMVESGGVSWQNALTSRNDAFFHDGGRVADEMFLNFRWSAAGIAASQALATQLGRSPYELFAGIDVEQRGFATPVSWSALFPPGAPQRLSIGLYRPEWTFTSSTSIEDFYARDQQFWVSGAGASWKGIAAHVPAQSVISALPFFTSFNTGHGSLYAVDGQVRARGDWNNLAIQDLLPTWRWEVESAGTSLQPALDWTEAYQGGSSLKISGVLDAVNRVPLYLTRLPVTADTELTIVFQTKSGDAHAQVALRFADAPTVDELLDLGAGAGPAWERRTFSLAPYAGRTLSELGLRFAASAPVRDYRLRVGQLGVYRGPIDQPALPTNFAIADGSRLSWTRSTDPVARYQLYRRRANGSRDFLGATPGNVFYVPPIVRLDDEPYTDLELEPVSLEEGHSARAVLTLIWTGGPTGVGP
jgi:endo-beta-N-acetylglucosaminidase D